MAEFKTRELLADLQDFREECEKLVQPESWLPHFEPDDPIVYVGDEDCWPELVREDEALD